MSLLLNITFTFFVQFLGVKLGLLMAGDHLLKIGYNQPRDFTDVQDGIVECKNLYMRVCKLKPGCLSRVGL